MKEITANKKIKQNTLIAVLIVAAFCALNLIVLFYFFGFSNFQLKQYAKQMPAKELTAEEMKKHDIYSLITTYSHYDIDYYQLDYGDDYFNSVQAWRSEKGFFKPTKKLPDRFCKDCLVWVLNDNPDYLIYVQGEGVKGCSGRICIKKELIENCDFLKSELTSVEVGDVEIAGILSDEDIETVRLCVSKEENEDLLSDFVNNFDADEFGSYAEKADDIDSASDAADEYLDSIKEKTKAVTYGKIDFNNLKQSYTISWHFKGLDGIYREKGVVAETKDGRIYVASSLHEKWNSETDGYYWNDELFELNGDLKSEMQSIVDRATESKRPFNEYDLAKEMKESVNS